MSFTFIHAADLHLDSPLAALGAKDAAVAARFALAGRRAVTALVDETLRCNAAFLLIAGDLFDGEWRDVATGQFMVRELARLSRAGIPAFLIKGNHDAESLIARNLPYPDLVTLFGARKAGTHVLEAHRVAIHGRSFADRVPPEGFVASYPPPRAGWFNIGLLHTALDGARGDHADYAPCTVAQLQAFGYDYWALGHIHLRQTVSRDPWIVYPGNVQGRSVRETGAKGATRVTVADGKVASAEHVVLDGARWAHEQIDISSLASLAEVEAGVAARLGAAHAAAQGRPLALRVTLCGTSALHAALAAGQADLLADTRARASHLAEDFWVERLRLEISAPAQPVSHDGMDVAGLLMQAARSGGLEAELARQSDLLGGKLPADLREAWGAVEPSAWMAQAQALLAGRLVQGTAGRP